MYPGGFRRGKGVGRRRVLGGEDASNIYHAMSRTAGGEMLLGYVEKEAFVRVMRRLERFSGVEVLTYAVMGNHFHLLVRVPLREKWLERFEGEGGEGKLLEHLGKSFGPTRKDGARKMKEAGGLGLFSLRALRVRVVE